ncbi:MAG TPA: sialidase family protein [Trebonia sp.]|nr:sialidase family protein [Trebonia sp.]
MPDEIDLLREFRADTPGPDDAARERARAAVALAESADIAPGPGAHRQWPRGIGRIRVGRITKGQVRLAAAAALVAGVVVTVLQPTPTLTAPLVSAWQPARQLPSDSAGIKAQAGSWRLMGYLVARGWQENTSGPEPGMLTCPTATTCYVEGNSAKSSSGPSDMNSFYASGDGAQTWSVLPVPEGVTFTSALSCASATDCTAGGLYYGHQPVYISSVNGGHSWTVRPLPAAVGQIITLACATATSCRGLVSASGQTMVPGISSIYKDLRFFVTSDGGRHLTVVKFPEDAAMQSVSCPTASHCVAIGVRSKYSLRDGPDLDHGVLLTSDDGGMTWQRGVWPKGYGPGFAPDVTCSDASHCAMIGFVEHGGIERFAYGYTSGKDAVQYSVIGFSADGGKTWTRTSRFPRSMPYPLMNALTCPTSATCYAAGSDAIPEHIGNTYNDGSAVVAVTHDAGRTWQRVTFDVPARVPGGMQGDSFMDIGQIQCPQADACVAMGISDQGSTSTPVYTNHG